jgi:hypothetical protein
MTQQLINVGTVAGDGTGDRGQVPGQKVNSNCTDLYSSAVYLGTDTGSVNAMVVAAFAPQPAAPIALAAGMTVRVIPAVLNTGPATLNFGGTGVRAIVSFLNTALVGGELQSGIPTNLMYDGTSWRQQISPNAVAQSLNPQTAIELAASVTPANYAYANGPFRYGAVSNGSTNDAPAWNTMGKVRGYHFVPTSPAPTSGAYLFFTKVQTQGVLTIEGADRQWTTIEPLSFTDYVFEVGASSTPGGNQNLGQIKRLGFTNGKAANLGMLHMNVESQLWRLDDLLFQTNACPALVVDTCYDSNYTNIDIYNSGGNAAPSAGAAVILRSAISGNSTNNIYFRGLHIEQCIYGCMYIGPGCAPIHWDTGKIDQGFNAGQVNPAIYIDGNPATLAWGFLFINNWTITGVYNAQYSVYCKGSLKLGGQTYWVGGSTAAAFIFDGRGWGQINSASSPGAGAASYGPKIPPIDLGSSYFGRTSISVNSSTLAAVQSKIPGIRALLAVNVTTTAASGSFNTLVQTNNTFAANGYYNNCYLVYNPNGTQPAFRRQILQTIAASGASQLVVIGTGALPNSGDYSIEYCGGHYTPNFRADQIILDQQMTLFAVLFTGITISGSAAYLSSAGSGASAGTYFTTSLAANVDYTGYYLVNEQTGEPYLITYGSDGGSIVSVPYNRTAEFQTGATYSMVAGYAHGAKQVGDSLEWSFAGKRKTALISALLSAGFDTENFPVWGFSSTGSPVVVPYTTAPVLDLSQGEQFVVVATGAITFGVPVNASDSNSRLLITVQASGTSVTPAFNAIFKTGTISALSSGTGASYDFFWDGTHFRQINTPIAIPN